MASELCKVLILSRPNAVKSFFCIKQGLLKTNDWSNIRISLNKVLYTEPRYPLNVATTTELMPMSLVIFDSNETN